MEPRTARSIAWHRTQLDRDTLRSLNQRSDLKGFLQLGGHLGLLAALGTVAWNVQDRLSLLLPVLFLYGTCYVFLYNATHELSHNSVFRTRFLNELFLWIFCFLGWRSYVLFWASHAEHHKYTLHPPDDLEVIVPANITLRTFLRTAVIDPWTMLATLRRTVMHAVGRIEGEWETHLFFQVGEEKKRRRLFNWARFLLLGHGSLVGLSIYFGWWVLPVLTSFGGFYGGWLRFLCNNTQHAGLPDNVQDFRRNSRTVILNPLFRFLYWHMNFHIEHHMYAAVPCYNLGRLHRAVKHDLPDCPNGLIAAWKEIISALRAQRLDPSLRAELEQGKPHVAV